MLWKKSITTLICLSSASLVYADHTTRNINRGLTTVKEGELHRDSTIEGDVNVEKQGTLSGNLTITNIGNLTNAGRVISGEKGVGKITLGGNFINQPSGRLEIDITPNGTVRDTFLSIGGAARLNGGVLEVTVNEGNYIKGTQYIVIDAPTRGKFAKVIQSGDVADLVEFEIDYGSLILTISENRIFADQTFTSDTAMKFADYLRSESITPGSELAILVEELGTLNKKEINRALVDLSPVNYGALELINARNNSYAADLLSLHLFELCCSPRDCCSCNTSAWMNVFGNLMNNRKKFDWLAPFEANAVGVLAGLDYCFNPCFYLGGSLGYTHTHLKWKNDRGGGDINSYFGALYGSYRGGCFDLDLSLISGGSDYDLKRNLITINKISKSDLWGYFLTGHLGLRTNWQWCSTTFEPFALVDYHYFYRQSFKESLDLHVKNNHQNMLRSETGLKVYYTFVRECSCFAPYLGLSWVGEFPLNTSKQKASFKEQSCIINVTSFDSSVHLGSPQAGFKWTSNRGFSFQLGYKGLFNEKTFINELEGRLEWIF